MRSQVRTFQFLESQFITRLILLICIKYRQGNLQAIWNKLELPVTKDKLQIRIDGPAACFNIVYWFKNNQQPTQKRL